jgi:hypothetical protein
LFYYYIKLIKQQRIFMTAATLPGASSSQPMNQGVSIPKTDQSREGSFFGKAIKWLNETSNGRLLKAVGWGALGVVATAANVACYVGATLFAAVGILATFSGAGAPVGLIAFGISAMCVAGAVGTMPLIVASISNCRDNLMRAECLGRQGK